MGEIRIEYYDFWKESDRTVLRPLVLGFIQAQYDRGGDLLPTERNVEKLIDVGMALAKREDPTYIIRLKAKVIAYIMWGNPNPEALDARWKTCHTFGSYVIPEERHKGVADTTREVALDQARLLGYERIIGPVHMTNERGLKEFISKGAWPTTVQMELLL